MERFLIEIWCRTGGQFVEIGNTHSIEKRFKTVVQISAVTDQLTRLRGPKKENIYSAHSSPPSGLGDKWSELIWPNWF